MSNMFVRVWEEQVIIPTYPVGPSEKNPMFFEKRVYQGSSGVVYPNPVIEKIIDQKEDKVYKGLFLENKYLKIMILPELGGRVQMAYDKIKNRHFIYYNQVIKPALVGLAGPWISGGIEFNWPQHHRPSTFQPIDYDLGENPDGSKTVWVNEIDQMFGTKGMAGFTLYPDKAYLEIKAQLYNRTNLPQTFLWWANPAVKVNDDYQSIFPPDVNAVFDHGKRDVSTFPIATGKYYKVDYGPGTDISRYKNIPVPTSYMAINSAYDFMGGYEHDTKAGVLHVANHHVSPGKKQWTWGYSDFGQAWDRNLTDDDGPYIELMTGLFTDNQPDFTWLMPFEEKSFTQYFLPYRELGLVKNANKDLLLNVERDSNAICIKIFATSCFQNMLLILLSDAEELYSFSFDISPEKDVCIEIEDVLINMGTSYIVKIYNENDKEVLVYAEELNKKYEIPNPAKAAAKPSEIDSIEQLYLIGLHLEQYRHATYHPVDYYHEALKRDAKDIRNNNALGLWYLRRGKFQKSIPYFNQAIESLISRNPNPYDGEPYYNLGLALKYQKKYNEAFNAFYKSVWSNSWQDIGYFSLAQIDLIFKNYDTALDHINKAIDRNANNSRAYVLKSAILRKLNLFDEALIAIELGLKRDRFNLGLVFEKINVFDKLLLIEKSIDSNKSFVKLSRQANVNILSYARDYASAGLYQEGIDILYSAGHDERTPMIDYYLAYYHFELHQEEKSKDYLQRAYEGSPYLCFPNNLEDIAVLEYAINKQSNDHLAPYYLGNLWYDKRQYDLAIQNWELSKAINSKFPTVLRNLGLASFNKLKDSDKAVLFYEEAFALDETDARVLMELDQLYKRVNRCPNERLFFLEQHLAAVLDRDDLYLERINLYNYLEKFDVAYDLIMDRNFHPWEGGEGKVSAQYIYSLVEMAKLDILNKEYDQALSKLTAAQTYPHNLGEGKLYGAQENDIFYWIAKCYQLLGDKDQSRYYFQKTTVGLSEPGAAIYYNDQQPDKIFYQGIAWIELGHLLQAKEIFNNLKNYAIQHLDDEIEIDYFAVSLPNLIIFDDNLNLRNKIHCLYMLALGHLGLNDIEQARSAFYEVLELDQQHLGAKTHLSLSFKHRLYL